jgi:putative transposase
MELIMEQSANKAQKIRNAIQETKERRKKQRPVVFQLKLQNLSKEKEKSLERAFLEAKWLYNWLISDIERLNLPINKVKEVEVKVKEGFEKRELILLGSQIKQEIADRIKDNLKSLSQLKNKGHKVGKLSYKPFVNSIPLKQYNVTFSLEKNKNRVKIQKLGSFRVLGFHQIPHNAEIANAVLVRKPSGYYLHVTCYIPKEQGFSEPIGEVIAIDFGVHSKLTLSNGVKIDFEVRESERIKKLQRKLEKTKRGSKNRNKVRFLLRREYEKITNKRKDAQNKVIAFLKGYKQVIFQEDFVKSWASLFGRQVHSSGIGGLKARLRNSLAAPIPVDRYEPTTKECFVCGKLHKLSLGDRIFKCECGWTCDRDYNAALVILRKGLSLSPNQAVGLDRSELKPLEREAIMRILGSNPYIRITSLKEEALTSIGEGGDH